MCVFIFVYIDKLHYFMLHISVICIENIIIAILQLILLSKDKNMLK